MTEQPAQVLTEVRGAGLIITTIKEGTTKTGDGYFNFLVRTDDSNIVRIQFWNQDIRGFNDIFQMSDPKGQRIGFRGTLRGVYDEKSTVVCRLADIRIR